MTSTRRKSRELALQCLYQVDQGGQHDKGVQIIKDNFEAPKKAVIYAEQLSNGVNQHRLELDGLIEKYAVNWRVARLDVVDRNILRIAFYEMLYSVDVPKEVAVDEAVEIAKRFSADESPAFINGVLDGAIKAMKGNDDKKS